jgi:hypothetical protein
VGPSCQRIGRLQQLIAGLSKEYTHFRYAIGLDAHNGELSSYAIHIGNAYGELSKARMALVRIVEGIERMREPPRHASKA